LSAYASRPGARRAERPSGPGASGAGCGRPDCRAGHQRARPDVQQHRHRAPPKPEPRDIGTTGVSDQALHRPAAAAAFPMPLNRGPARPWHAFMRCPCRNCDTAHDREDRFIWLGPARADLRRPRRELVSIGRYRSSIRIRCQIRSIASRSAGVARARCSLKYSSAALPITRIASSAMRRTTGSGSRSLVA